MFGKKPFLQIMILLVAGLLVACQSSETPVTPTPVVLAKRLVTVAPTLTPNNEDRQATQQAAIVSPTLPPPSPTATATPYIGVFIGEVELDTNNTLQTNPLDILILPTRSAASNRPMICTMETDTRVFGVSWQNAPYAVADLRCPIQQSYGFNGTVQSFEGGAMYFNPATNEVWAIAPGIAPDVGHYWYEDHPPAMSTQGIEAPEAGLRVPISEIGAVWVSNPQLRERLGYATTRQQNSSVNIQRFEGGSLFLDATVGQVFILLVNGSALGGYNID